MKPLSFSKAFLGPFFGVIIYRALIGSLELFHNYWANFFIDAIGMAVFIFVCFLIMDWVSRMFFFSKEEETA